MGPEFHALPGAEGWQLSNPPILAMAPLVASLEHFDSAGLPALRHKSIALTGYLATLIQHRLPGRVRIITPAVAAARGAALSLRLEVSRDRAFAVFEALRRRGVVTDWREPPTIRVAPVPFYNGYDDVWRCVDALVTELA
jgi:kynureninase